jgi:ArsR family transcriptional regulator, arsenate/arsenite/antimonite-responsive transcriptional repressor
VGGYGVAARAVNLKSRRLTLTFEEAAVIRSESPAQVPASCAAVEAVRRRPPPKAAESERLARVAKALSDPIRLSMLDVMAQGRSCCGLPAPAERGVPGKGDPQGICVCDFQEHFSIGQSKVSYHLRVLKEAGLVREEARGKWTFYAIDGQAAAEALDALRDLLRI